MTGKLLFAAVALLRVASAMAGVPPSPETKPPRPGPDFPALESYYPAEAKRAGQEGAAIIRFCVDTEGRLSAPPTVSGSSGNEALDAAALNLANAGSGRYLPGYANGVAQAACSQFKIKFELRDDPVLARATQDPRLPTITARLRALSAEYGRRMIEVQKVVEKPAPMVIAPGDPAAVRTLRQIARSLDAALDQSVGMAADMLDDMEYLGKDAGIPEQERTLFITVWPDERAGLAHSLRQMIGASRDIVRSMDEMADYVAFSTPRRSPDGSRSAAPTPAEDPQIEEIRQRALKAFRRLQSSVEALSGGS